MFASDLFGLDLILGWASLVEKVVGDFKQKIDYKEFEAKINYDDLDGKGEENNAGKDGDWDETRSYSTIRLVDFLFLIGFYVWVVAKKQVQSSQFLTA